MPGRKSSESDRVDWQVIYEICADPRVAPGDRAAEARRRGVDRSKIQVERYFVAADLINRYHATDLINLRSVSDGIWHQLEQQLLADLEEELDSPDPDACYRERDRILGQVTRPMLERAAAGWHAWEAAQVAAQEEPAASVSPGPGPRQGWRRWWLAGGAGIGVLAVVAGLAGAVLARRPALSVSYVGLLPESYLTGGHFPAEHQFVGYRFRVEGDNLPTVSPENLWRIIERPPDCPTTGYGFETPNSVDLFIYCTTDMAPGRYRLRVTMPDGRKAHTTFSPQVPPATAAPASPASLGAPGSPGDDVAFLFDRAGLKGPRGLMQQAIYRLSRRVVDGKTYISFTLNLPEDAGDIDYILNAGTEARSDMYQALPPIRPARAESPPAEQPPTG